MSKSNNMSLLWIILSLLFMALSAWLWFDRSNLQTELGSLKSEHVELDKLLKDLESLRGDNQELNDMIEAQKADLASQKKRISGLIWTERELGKAREEIASMQSMASQYVSEISALKAKNQKLTDQNVQLTAANTEMSEEIVVNKKRINNLDSVKTILVGETEELSKDNDMLSTKVDMAEAIKINWIEVKGYDVKDDGSVKAKSRAKKVEMLRACFKTETNMVVPAGEEEFFVSLVSPAGETLYVEELGSGSITNKLTGESVRYTSSGTVDYNNDDLSACLDWKPNFALNKGIYKVHIYNNGFNVGNGEFKLK